MTHAVEHAVKPNLDAPIILLKRPYVEALLGTNAARKDYPYCIWQAAELREYGEHRRRQFVGEVALSADCATAVVSVEQEVRNVEGYMDRQELHDELAVREAGFSQAGKDQTGLQPPANYRRIAAVAAGFVHILESDLNGVMVDH